MRIKNIFEALICVLIAGIVFLTISLIPSCSTTTTTPAPTPSESPISDSMIIPNIDVSQSACAQKVWKQRGRAPMGYYNQIAINYHKMFCAKVEMKGAATEKRDAIVKYGLTPTLKSTYTLLIGLGLRESTGNYCAGRDTSASNTDAFTAEAGAFQSSYNSMAAHPTLKKVYEFYKSNPDQCNKQTTCNSKGYGDGEGAIFQRLSKDCPQFAIEYNAILIRVLANHFGPLIRKEAEYAKECEEMLTQVEKIPCPAVWTL